MHNKLSKPFCIQSVPVIIFLIMLHAARAQDSLSRPSVINTWYDYTISVKQDPSKRMTDLRQAIPALLLDLRYASTNNFTKKQMYDPAPITSFLRAPAADALVKVQQELAASGLGLKIFDAYRPYSVTVKFWKLVQDERYVANPARGSGHNRGAAVDLTIVRLADSSELEMGTGFDNFSDTAHHSFQQLPKEVQRNRRLLQTTMEKYGFKSLETEWWHYSLPESARFELLDIPFLKLQEAH